MLNVSTFLMRIGFTSAPSALMGASRPAKPALAPRPAQVRRSLRFIWNLPSKIVAVQKSSLAANWTWRGLLPAALTTPKVARPNWKPGLPNRTWFNTLKNSARICRLKRSSCPKRLFLNSAEIEIVHAVGAHVGQRARRSAVRKRRGLAENAGIEPLVQTGVGRPVELRARAIVVGPGVGVRRAVDIGHVAVVTDCVGLRNQRDWNAGLRGVDAIQLPSTGNTVQDSSLIQEPLAFAER